MNLGLRAVPGSFQWEPLNFGWTLADVLKNRDSQQTQQQGKTKRRTMAQGNGSKLEGLIDSEKATNEKSELEVRVYRIPV